MLFNLVISHLALASLVCGSFFSDILKGIFQANRYSNLITSIPENVIEDLESDEADAGLFVCQILNGDFPQAFEQIGSEIVGDVESDFASLTSFILSIPTLAPEILEDLVQDGEDVVSVIGELFTNPEAAVTVIIGGVESVVNDVWGDIETVGGDILCFFGLDCPSAAATTVVNTAAMMLSSTCQGILASAPAMTTTAYAAATTTPASPLTTPSAAQPTTITTPPSAATTGDGAAACNSAEYVTSYCESATDGFDNMPQSQQASCLCYTADSSAGWVPDLFDSYVSDCAQYLPSTDPNQAVFQGLEGFCADAGNVYTMTTAEAAPTTLDPIVSPPTTTPTPTPTFAFTHSVGGAPIPTTQPAGVITPSTAASAAASTNTAAVQTQNAGPADPSVGLLWLWIAPLSAVCGIMLML
ncbi:Mucin-5B [Xylographa parallela]|nr:Mucin-5B [Xylographa parallela]